MATATLNVEVLFNIDTGGGEDARKWELWDAAADGNLLFRGNLATDPAALAAQQGYRIPADTVVITQTAANGFTEAWARRALNGAIGSCWIALAASDDTALTESGRRPLVIGNWTIAAS